MAQTNKYSVNLGLAQLPEITDPRLFPEFNRIYNAARNLAYALDEYTGAIQRAEEDWPNLSPVQTLLSSNLNRLYIQCSEAVTAGQLVNFWNDAGKLKARLATDTSLATRARAYAATSAPAGGYIEAILHGIHPLIAGLTPGAIYYLSNSTPGAITTTALSQKVGYAMSANLLFFMPHL